MKISSSLFCFILLFSIFSCSDDGEENMGGKNLEFVSRKLLNAKLDITDSLETKIQLEAPIIEEHEFAKEPYTIFPKGAKLTFIEEGKEKPGYLYADYGKVIEKTGWYEVKKNVIIINPEGDTLKTNHAFWDKNSRKIFSNDTVRIYRADGVTTNISTGGVEASDDLKNIKFKNNSGTFPYNENMQTQ